MKGGDLFAMSSSGTTMARFERNRMEDFEDLPSMSLSAVTGAEIEYDEPGKDTWQVTPLNLNLLAHDPAVSEGVLATHELKAPHLATSSDPPHVPPNPDDEMGTAKDHGDADPSQAAPISHGTLPNSMDTAELAAYAVNSNNRQKSAAVDG
ncbi:hypothetical protein G7Y79_00050g086130 [Physcia stellaris]|nr:hypothetical protein G7Y79_00050g086130 [Physcia stellaris]